MNSFDKIDKILNIDSEVKSAELIAVEKPEITHTDEPKKDD